MKLSDARKQWEQEWGNLSKNTVKLYSYQSRKLESLYERDVQSIGRSEIRALSEGMSPGAGRGFLSVCNVFWNWMIENEITEKNVVPKMASSSKPTPPWSVDSIQAVLTSAPPHIRRIVRLCLVTGQRVGDVLRVRKGDIRNGVLFLTQEKTGVEVEIKLDDQTLGLIASSQYDLVCSSDGQPISYNRFYKAAKPIFIHYGVPKGIHGLRVWHANSFGEAGASSRQIMTRLGHKSIRTSERYTQLMDRRKVEKGNAKYTEAILRKAGLNKWERK